MSGGIRFEEAGVVEGRPVSSAHPLPVTAAIGGANVITGPLGRAADAASVSVALSTEVVALIDGVETALASLRADVYPNGAIPIIGGSGNVANASAVATLDSDAAKTTYITGFEVTGSGATAGLPVTVTVAGLLGGTRHYTYTATVGALLPNTPLTVGFDPPLPASAADTDIVVTCPALGAGNTNNTVVAHGFKL